MTDEIQHMPWFNLANHLIVTVFTDSYYLRYTFYVTGGVAAG